MSNVLKSYGERVWYNMPVPYGFGTSTLDYLCCINGKFVAIETKAAGRQLTEKQKSTAQQITDAGGYALRVASEQDIPLLNTVIQRILDGVY